MYANSFLMKGGEVITRWANEETPERFLAVETFDPGVVTDWKSIVKLGASRIDAKYFCLGETVGRYEKCRRCKTRVAKIGKVIVSVAGEKAGSAHECAKR